MNCRLTGPSTIANPANAFVIYLAAKSEPGLFRAFFLWTIRFIGVDFISGLSG
jgi:hypothetical protein